MTPNNRKLVVALFLGVIAIVLAFFLGERFQTSPTIVRGVIFVAGTAGYYVFSAFLLSRGDPREARPWAIPAALAAPFLILVLIGVAAEPNKGAVLLTAVVWILVLLSAAAGTALARRSKRA